MNCGGNTPEIRFRGFDGAWEEIKANSIFTTVADKGYPELPVLSATQDRGMIKREDNNINIFHNKGNEVGYKRVLPGNFVIHLRSFQGGFAHSTIEGITSPAYTVLEFVEKGRHFDNYWKYVLMSEAFIKRLETVTYGIRDGRSISYEDFSDLRFIFPSCQEQQQIGAFFERLVALIALYRRRREQLSNVKKSLQEKMFPREGAKVPEIRFEGFAGEWETKKIGELITPLPFKPFLANPQINGDYAIIQQGNNPIIGYANGRPFTDYENVILFGDHTLSLYKPQKPFFISTDGIKILSSVERFNTIYLFYLLERYKPLSEGYKRYFTILCNTVCQITSNITEQQQIGAFFQELDGLLALSDRRLRKLENVKKSFLSKLFVSSSALIDG